MAFNAQTQDEATSDIMQVMSPRQIELNVLWAWFKCLQYENRKMDWSGNERLGFLDFEAAASAGLAPDGFQITQDTKDLPLKFRKPTAPYNIVKVVVERFTSMLFSQRRHPTLSAPSEPDTEGWTNAAAESGRLWPTFVNARNMGGAMGTVCVGFSFVDGKPKFEVHDPRWCNPKFVDQQELELESIEKLYPFQREEWNAQRKRYEPCTYWYRRTIDLTTDIVYEPLEDKTYREAVKKGEPPPWIVKFKVQHDLGFFPGVWIQNLPVDGEIDGEPDCAGIYETAEAIDALYAQANAGTVMNCDPTLFLKSDAELGEISMGHKNVLKVNQGDDGKFLEINATGIKAARELAQEFKVNALEVVSCVLDNATVGDRATAAEVEKAHAPMLAKCDILREQYGSKGVVPLMEKVMRAAKAVEGKILPPAEGSTKPVRLVIKLPPKVEKSADGQVTKSAHKLGEGLDLALKWPVYFIPTLNDAKMGADAVAVAREAKVLDQENAVKFTAEFFNVDNPNAMLQNLKQESEEERALVEEDLQRELDNQVKLAKETTPPAKPAAGKG